MLNHTFNFNGHSSDEFGIKIEKFRAMNRPARKYNAASVPGRNGNIYKLQAVYEEVSVSYKIWAKLPELSAEETFARIMEWLNSADGYAKLTDTYDPDHYREAVFVDQIDIANSWNEYGKATVMFRCRPERFLKNTDVTLDLENTVTKWFTNRDKVTLIESVSYSWHPIASLKLNEAVDVIGTGTLVARIYRPDSVNVYAQPNTSSTIKGTARAEELLYVTNAQEGWYKVQNGTGYLSGWVIDDGNWTTSVDNYSQVQTEDGIVGWCGSGQLTQKEVIVYNNPTNHIARPVFTVESDSADMAISINGVSATISNVNLPPSSDFQSMIIDCENENVEGTYIFQGETITEAMNKYTAVTNVNGSLSTVFPRLKKGDNYIAVSGTGTVTMSARTWEV